MTTNQPAGDTYPCPYCGKHHHFNFSCGLGCRTTTNYDLSWTRDVPDVNDWLYDPAAPEWESHVMMRDSALAYGLAGAVGKAAVFLAACVLAVACWLLGLRDREDNPADAGEE